MLDLFLALLMAYSLGVVTVVVALGLFLRLVMSRGLRMRGK